MHGPDANDRLRIEVDDGSGARTEADIIAFGTDKVLLRVADLAAPVCGLGATVSLHLTDARTGATLELGALTRRRTDHDGRREYELEFVDPDALWQPSGVEIRKLVDLRTDHRVRPPRSQPIEVTVEDGSPNPPVRGEMSDLSVAGIAVVVEGAVEDHLAQADHVTLFFELPPVFEPIAVRGRIRQRSLVHGGRRYGIAFDAEQPGDAAATRASIEQYVTDKRTADRAPVRIKEASRTIQSKISLAMWTVTLGFLVLAVLTVLHLNDRLARKEVADRLHQGELNYENHSSLRHRYLHRAATRVAASPEIVAALEAGDVDHRAALDLAREEQHHSEADLVVLVDGEGRVVANSLYPGTARGAWRDVSSILEMHDTLFLVASAPVTAGGRTRGTVVLGERVDADLAAEIQAVTHTDVLVVHGDKLVAGSWRETTRQPISESNLAELVQLKDSGIYHRLSLGGLESFAGMVPLGERSFLVLSLSVADLMTVYRTLLLWVAGAAVIIGGLSLWLSRFIADKLSRPIRHLTRVASELAEGNLDVTVQETDTRELAVLGESFHRMARRIEQLLASVRHKSRLVAQQRAELELAGSKEEFLAIASHELRTPVTSIASFAEILLSCADDEDRATRDDFLQIIAAESQRLSRLIHRLLELAEIRTGMASWTVSEMDLAQVVRSTVKTLLGPTAAPVEVVIDVPGQPCPYSGDEDRIRTVITNVVANGLKFSPEGAELTVALREVGGGWEIRVADRGPGVPDDQKERIFEKFVQGGKVLTDRPRGAGLGLSISEELVEAHGGRMHCEDREGGGAVFVIFLPFADEAGPRPVDARPHAVAVSPAPVAAVGAGPR